MTKTNKNIILLVHYALLNFNQVPVVINVSTQILSSKNQDISLDSASCVCMEEVDDGTILCVRDMTCHVLKTSFLC